jgi:four helix bundle protein
MGVVKVIDSLPYRRSVDVLGKQLLRSASSIGANYRAACRSRSKAEFVSKMHIVQEEADETQYWIDLLHESGAISDEDCDKLLAEAKELTAIFTASEKTARVHLTHR